MTRPGRLGVLRRSGTANGSELLWQIQRFHSFLWASGGAFSDFYIHVIDHCCWMKNAWPVKVQAVGGRHYKTTPDGKPCIDQNFDSYSVEYTFADGAKLLLDGRCMGGANTIYSSYAHGSKGCAVVSQVGRLRRPVEHAQGPELRPQEQIWESKTPAAKATRIRTSGTIWSKRSAPTSPTTRSSSGVMASVVTSMGRMAAHTAKEITLRAVPQLRERIRPRLRQVHV